MFFIAPEYLCLENQLQILRNFTVWKSHADGMQGLLYYKLCVISLAPPALINTKKNVWS